MIERNRSVSDRVNKMTIYQYGIRTAGDELVWYISTSRSRLDSHRAVLLDNAKQNGDVNYWKEVSQVRLVTDSLSCSRGVLIQVV